MFANQCVQIETYQWLFANRKPCVVVPNGSFRQSGRAQRIRIFCVIFGAAKNPDSILEIGKAHVGVELKGARDSFSRLLQSSGERVAGRRNAQRGEDVWAFPERFFSP